LRGPGNNYILSVITIKPIKLRALRCKKAEAGIGTSIMLIALISISGVAGSMVIDNTSLTAEQAQDVVDETLDNTVTYLDVRSVVGVCDPERELLTSLEMVVVIGPGSQNVNLSSMVIELMLPWDHVFLASGEGGFSSERILSGGLVNSTSIIGDGDIFVLSFDLPNAITCGEEVRLSLTPAEGFVNFLILDVPSTLTTRYVSLR